MVTGFEYSDPATGERLAYNSTRGTYNAVRARALLGVYRDPNR